MMDTTGEFESLPIGLYEEVWLRLNDAMAAGLRRPVEEVAGKIGELVEKAELELGVPDDLRALYQYTTNKVPIWLIEHQPNPHHIA